MGGMNWQIVTDIYTLFLLCIAQGLYSMLCGDLMGKKSKEEGIYVHMCVCVYIYS